MASLVLHKLTRHYPERTIGPLDLEVESGQILGLLGPNGAGKTTTISMIAGLLPASAGQVLVNGSDLARERAKVQRAIGLVPQELALYESLSAFENLQFFASLYELDTKQRSKAITWALSIAGLESRSKDIVREFSGGMKRRLNIAIALLHHPQLLILDEPTVGVDPQSRNHIFEAIRRLHSEEKLTIVYTSHYMEEVQRLCQRVAIVDQGKLIANDDVHRLLENQNTSAIRLKLKEVTEVALSICQSFGNTQVTEGHVEVDLQQPLSALVQKLEEDKIYPLQITRAGADLEGLFLKLTGKSLRDEA